MSTLSQKKSNSFLKSIILLLHYYVQRISQP